jgi:hypothetical protein
MNQAEVQALLAIAVAYDNRKPGEATIAAWMEAAERGRWTFPAAMEAIHEHYATSTAFLMPGHITAAMRAQMRQPAPYAEIEASEPASEETRSRFAALIRDRFSVPRGVRRDRRAQRRSAEDAEARERARRELDAVREREGLPDV